MPINICNFAYDKNGNLVYVNTNRVMTDGHRDNSVGERKLIWDEENRLLAVDDNGFVSNYWYDADGERTVKTSGESDQVYVNGVFSGGSTNTAKFSLYVSPYLVANQGGRYTKHIYAGSQRIVSKVGDFASYGSDPRRIEYAGANTDGLSVDYKAKYAAQQQVIKDNYKFFDVPYNGTDNDNYADGEGFCCNDGSMEAAVAQARKAQTRAVARSFKDPDNYENLQFFYHPAHLGSSSFITNLDGEVVQHIEYVPFGEVFIEERNNVWNTPYLFNAKEFDEETGMYYYGARYYDPRLSLWMSTDPMQEKYSGYSTYTYCYNNPIIFIDVFGLEGEGSSYWQIPRFSKGSYGSNWFYNSLTFLNNVSADILNTGVDIINSPIIISQIAYNEGGEGLINEVKAEASAIGTFFQNQYTYATQTPFKQQFWDTVDGFSNPENWESSVAFGVSLYFGGSFSNASKGICNGSRVAIGTSSITGRGFKSFDAFKRAMGPAGEGQAWHHIVKQTPSNVSRFGAEAIHNTSNLVKLPHGKGSLHNKITGYYNSKQPFTGGMTVRKWLSTQSYEQQYEFGVQVMKKFGWKE